MVTTALRGIDWLILTIDDGARPGSRRMSTGLQNLSAEMTGSRHTHSTFHPASRCVVHLVCWQWTDHKFRVCTRVSIQLLMPILRLPGGCIAFVLISPDVMKIPFDAWFGFAGLMR